MSAARSCHYSRTVRACLLSSGWHIVHFNTRSFQSKSGLGWTSEPHEEPIQPAFTAYRKHWFPYTILAWIIFFRFEAVTRPRAKAATAFRVCVIISPWGRRVNLCTLGYVVNQPRKQKAAMLSLRVKMATSVVVRGDGSALSAGFKEFCGVVIMMRKTNTIPATQLQSLDILPNSYFLFFCWFLLSHSISLGIDHRYFIALSPIFSVLLSFLPVSIWSKPITAFNCYSLVPCSKSIIWLCCMQKQLSYDALWWSGDAVYTVWIFLR